VISPLHFLRKLHVGWWRVKSWPEIEIADKKQKICIFYSNPLHRALIQNRPKTGENVDFSKSASFLKIFRVQHVALTVRLPKHPYLMWSTVELSKTELRTLLPL
jgi:hypothetical protein